MVRAVVWVWELQKIKFCRTPCQSGGRGRGGRGDTYGDKDYCTGGTDEGARSYEDLVEGDYDGGLVFFLAVLVGQVVDHAEELEADDDFCDADADEGRVGAEEGPAALVVGA